MTIPKPLRGISDSGGTDLVFLIFALIGGIAFSLPLLLLVTFGYLSFRTLGMRAPTSFARFATAGLALTALLVIASKSLLGPLAHQVGGWISDTPGISDGVDFTDWRVYLAYLGISIFTAGFLEEVVYRGYLLQRLAARLPQGALTWPVAILISNVSFALWHAHGGADSVVFSFLMGVLLSILFLVTGRRLWLIIFAHASYDVIIISLRFFQLSIPLPELI